MGSTLDLRVVLGQRQAVTAPAPHESGDDTALVVAAREGDRAAFGRLYDRYARMVHGILLARIPHGEVSDLVQDVFLQALRHLHSLRDHGAFGGWLAMIARNRANDFHRHNREMHELPEEIGGPHPRHAEAHAALKAIQSLPEAYRETLMLRLVEGMTGPEIAARTGMSPGSVRVNLHRGMKQLREKLGWSEGHE